MSSDKPDTDFNDLHIKKGLPEVRRQLEAIVAGHDDVQDLPPRSVDEGYNAVSQENELPGTPPIDAYLVDDAVDEDYNPKNEAWYDGLTRADRGNGPVEGHAGNLEKIFSKDPRWKSVFGYCDFSYRIMFRGKPPIDHDRDEVGDDDIKSMRIWFHRHYWPMRPPQPKEIQDAISVVARRNRFHPVREYLKSLRHDGVERLDCWLKTAFGSRQPDRYLQLAGSKMLIAAVARVMRPGCKVDDMPILEGGQGKGKSTVIKILFGDWFSDALLTLGDKDAYQLMQGVWGYEMGEMDSFNRSEVTTAKQFASQQRDKFRPPYAASPVEFKRQTVFWGTTNQFQYFKDRSGNRRYWPIRCAIVNLEWVRQFRDQLWAEALKRFEAGEKWHVEDDEDIELFKAEQDLRLQHDAWEDDILEWLEYNGKQYVQGKELLKEAIKIDAANINDTTHLKRIATIMEALGWEAKKKRIQIGNKKIPRNVYVRPADDEDIAPF